jgi:hypothetical protein
LPAAFARSIAAPTVLHGLSCAPHDALSVPPGDTKTPKASLMTHGSVVTDGSSLFGRQSCAVVVHWW